MNPMETFRALHSARTPLLLPNAWDVAGARILEEAGATAIATTSAGIAWAQGAADGGVLNRDRMLVTLESIVAAVAVPVTADIEGGYAESPDGVTETVRLVCATGAAGINIEDGPRTPEDTIARIRAAREASDGLFINARTLGVARLSSGSAFAQSAYAGLRRDAAQFLTAARWPAIQMDYAELNRLATRG